MMIRECSPEITVEGDEHAIFGDCYCIRTLTVGIKCPFDNATIGAIIPFDCEIRPGHEMDSVESRQIESVFNQVLRDPSVIEDALFACKSSCRFGEG